jgi:hypothetical protein
LKKATKISSQLAQKIKKKQQRLFFFKKKKSILGKKMKKKHVKKRKQKRTKKTRGESYNVLKKKTKKLNFQPAHY